MSNNLVEKKKSRKKPTIHIKYCEVCQKETKHYTRSGKCLSCSSKNSRDKAKQTCLSKYGNEHYNNMEKIRATKLKKYGSEYYSNREKAKRTCLEIYGVEYALQNDDFKEKSKKTCLERYGVEYSLQSEAVKEKSRKACLEKYGVENASKLQEVKEKSKKTCLERYGVEHTLQVEEFREKAKITKLEKYGSSSYTNKDQAKQTCLEKYGVENYSQTDEFKDKFKQTCLERYGVEHALQNGELKEKFKQTCIERYGVENYSQSKDFRKKAAKKYKYQDIHFDSSWELAYYIYLTDNNKDFKYQCEPIEYSDLDGKKHLYFPDFEVEGQLIEIKGDHFFTESGQFINPFDRSEEADNHNQSKYNCMLEHNVKILKSSDMAPVIEYIDTTYGNQFLESCRC